MARQLVRIWDRDFNCVYSGFGDDVGAVLGDLTVTSDPADEDGQALGGWRNRTSGRIVSVSFYDDTVANLRAP